MKTKTFKVLFVADYCEPAVLSTATGISRYFATHPELELLLTGIHSARPGAVCYQDYTPDGVILISAHPDNHPALRAKSVKAAVAINWWSNEQRLTITSFMTDDRKIAELAFQHLLKNGLRHFAYVQGNTNTGWDDARRDFFVELTNKAGFSCDVLPCDPAEKDPSLTERLREFLASLPKPCGVFTPFDLMAKTVLDCCRAHDLSVPDQIQVVSVDNDSTICDNTHPTLTSIDAGFLDVGYEASRHLHEELIGKNKRPCVIKFSPRAVVTRSSTCDVRGIGRSVAAACEFMRVHALEPIHPAHVATAVHVSLRTLQMNFKNIRNEGIAEHLRKIRLDHVCRLLRETQMPLEHIPSYCCLGNTASTKTLFRRTFGMTMSDYRQAQSHQPRGKVGIRGSAPCGVVGLG